MCCGGPNSTTAKKKRLEWEQQQHDMLPEIRSPDASRLKLVLLGDSGVGKTCIVQRYVNDKFSVTTSAQFACAYLMQFHIREIGEIELNKHMQTAQK